MDKHTQGPWTADPEGDVAVAIEAANGSLVCEVYGAANNPTTEANARLIAAAPDMLAALERIRDARDSMAEHGKYPFPGPASDQEFDDWAADIAEAAIAKARGA